MKKNIFDLDLQVNKIGSQGSRDRVTSISLCTPGTCNDTCQGNTTLHSDCCPRPTTTTATTIVPSTGTCGTTASVISCLCATQQTCK